MPRRHATATPGKYEPLVKRRHNLRDAVPSAPTGRLIAPGNAKGTEVAVTHWLPPLDSEGVEWTCPECADRFLLTNALSADGTTLAWEQITDGE